MLSNKFVIRILDAEHQLLGWAEVYPKLHPGIGRASCGFVTTTPTKFLIEQDGDARYLVVHWCDPDLARIVEIMGAPVAVKKDQIVQYAWVEPVWLISGMRDVPMPTVTVRQSVEIGVPTGSIGVQG